MKLQRLRIWGVKDGRRIFIDQQGPELLLDPEVPELRLSEDVLAAAEHYLDEVVQIWQGGWGTDQQMQDQANAWNCHSKEGKQPPRLHGPEEMRQHLLHMNDLSYQRGYFRRPRAEIISRRSEIMSMSEDILTELASQQYLHDVRWWGPFDIGFMRELEYDDFIRYSQGPPFDWTSIAEYIKEHGSGQENWQREIGREDDNAQGGNLSAKGFTPPSDVLKCRDCLRPSRWIWYSCFPGPLCGSAGWLAICEDCQTWHQERPLILS